MQPRWASLIKEFVIDALVDSIGLAVLAIEAVYGSAMTSLVGHVITSKFVLRVLTALEYTVVVSNALFVALLVPCDFWRKLRRLTQ